MIKIICIGKIKEDYLKKGIEEYKKRITKYSKIEIIELDDESNGNILEKERDKILKYISEKDYIITLEINGNTILSVVFSKKNRKYIFKLFKYYFYNWWIIWIT